MSTDEDSKPAKPDKMELAIGATRMELVYTNERTERHLMPADHPPIPHQTDESCWCQPSLEFASARWRIYRHKRQQ